MLSKESTPGLHIRSINLLIRMMMGWECVDIEEVRAVRFDLTAYVTLACGVMVEAVSRSYGELSVVVKSSENIPWYTATIENTASMSDEVLSMSIFKAIEAGKHIIDETLGGEK